MQTPLHMAIAHNHPDVVSVILEQKGFGGFLCSTYFNMVKLPVCFVLFTYFVQTFCYSQCTSCNKQLPDHSRLQPQRLHWSDSAWLGSMDRYTASQYSLFQNPFRTISWPLCLDIQHIRRMSRRTCVHMCPEIFKGDFSKGLRVDRVCQAGTLPN